MSQAPTPRQAAVLRSVQEAGGFMDRVEDEDAAQECVDAGWLTAEDHQGYALTLDGAAEIRGRPRFS